jgi:glycolate oxidase
MVKPEILHKFTAILGPERVKTEKEDLLTYSYDAFIAEYAPEAVIFPKTTAEVAEIMKIANANGVFITPRGSGSGLSAATLA